MKALDLRRNWEIRDHKRKMKFERRNIFHKLHFSGAVVYKTEMFAAVILLKLGFYAQIA